MALIILFYRWLHWLRKENICPRYVTTVRGRTKTCKLSELGMKASVLLQTFDDTHTPNTSKASKHFPLSVNKASALSTKALFIFFFTVL